MIQLRTLKTISQQPRKTEIYEIYTQIISTMPSHRKYGGSRKGSGRKKLSETLGPPQSHSLNKYSVSTASTDTSNRQTVNNSTHSTSEQTPATNPRSIPNTTQTTNASVGSIPDTDESVPVPNNNINEEIDESSFITTQSISSSKKLSIKRKNILSKIFFAESYNNIIDNGILWLHPPQIIRKPQYNLTERWLDFFKLRVFDWIPEAMLGVNWRPNCLNCKVRLSRNGHDAEPRIVFD